MNTDDAVAAVVIFGNQYFRLLIENIENAFYIDYLISEW